MVVVAFFRVVVGGLLCDLADVLDVLFAVAFIPTDRSSI
jgi:hypothetical protein